MTAGRATELLRNPDRPRRSTYVELFFDVVFVFAVTRLSNNLFENLTWIGLWRTILLLAAFWWVWVLTTWMSGRLDPDRPSVQFLIVAVMLASLLMSVAVPTAFGDQGLLFAGLYVVSQAGRSVFVLRTLRNRGITVGGGRKVAWWALSAALWLAGGVADESLRGLLWSAAVIIDYSTAELRLPEYDLRGTGLTSSADHLAERFQQFTIIALGDKILAPALKLSEYDYEFERILALVVSFWTTVLLWRIYFYRAGLLLPAGIVASRDPGRYDRDLAHLHVVLVAGLVVSAASEDVIVSHPTGANRITWVAAIAGGPAIFLAGRMLLDKLTFNRVARSRVIGLLLLLAAAPATVVLPPMLVTTTVNVILTIVVVSDTISWRRHPRRPSPAR
ncbi:low temperature requirement protein A [Micromonospora coerulea]|uniref:Low temperature requirement protein A n=1 Tax=Micromonospora coerulea TaxID=47856 RepID=A0ABP8SRU6_9ACTN